MTESATGSGPLPVIRTDRWVLHACGLAKPVYWGGRRLVNKRFWTPAEFCCGCRRNRQRIWNATAVNWFPRPAGSCLVIGQTQAIHLGTSNQSERAQIVVCSTVPTVCVDNWLAKSGGVLAAAHSLLRWCPFILFSSGTTPPGIVTWQLSK